MARPAFVIRRATVDDAAIIGRHRADMYRDMGALPEEWRDALVTHTTDFLRGALESGEYVGWLAAAPDEAATIVGGGGALLRRRLPRVSGGEHPRVAPGREALIVNIFTEPDWRRRGVARRILQEILAWATADGCDSIVLHASDEGRALYESFGFRATNEMRYAEQGTREKERVTSDSRDK